ncbi:MAG: glycosyltransferase family 4 protein [Candidatus Aenigmatarchaeota archaeon]|nr:MAG: glycosyltransferase family 4 protein [Candidatus Aenigmarchaeota archaeon]
MRTLVNFYPIDVLPREDYMKICADAAGGDIVVVRKGDFFGNVRSVLGQRVHAHGRGFPFPEMAGLFARRSVYTPHFNTVGSSGLARFVRRFLFNRFTYVIAQTAYAKRRYMQDGVDARRIRVLPIPVDYGYFSKPVDGEKFRRKYGLGDKPFALCVGIRAMKNPLVILEACRKAGVTLVATGFKNADELKTSKALETGKNLEWLLPPKEFAEQEGDGLVLTGHIGWPELRAAYGAASVYVNSSDDGPECFCLSAYEAAAAGVPLCLPDFGVFEAFEGAALFHKNTDADALAKNISAYLEDRETAIKHASAAKLIAKQFDYPVVKKTFQNFYKEAGFIE